MIDYSKLSQIVDGKQCGDTKKSPKKEVPSKKTKVESADKIVDSKKTIKDSIAKRRAVRKYDMFKVTDAYKNYKKKIKDELEETETTDDAVAVAVEALNEVPAEQAIAAVVEVLGEAIDILQGQCPNGECIEGNDGIAEGDKPEAAEVAETEDKVEDSVNVTVINESGETVTVDANGGDTTITADANGGAVADALPVEEPIAEEPIAEEPIAEEPIAEEPIAEEPIAEEGIGDSKKIEDGMSQDEVNALDAAQGDIFAEIEQLISQGKNQEALDALAANRKTLEALGK